MKTTSLLALLVLLSSGCGDGYNRAKCRQAVIEEMKATEVVENPSQSYRYIVRTQDGAVWWVECLGPEATVTTKTLLFPPNK